MHKLLKPTKMHLEVIQKDDETRYNYALAKEFLEGDKRQNSQDNSESEDEKKDKSEDKKENEEENQNSDQNSDSNKEKPDDKG